MAATHAQPQPDPAALAARFTLYAQSPQAAAAYLALLADPSAIDSLAGWRRQVEGSDVFAYLFLQRLGNLCGGAGSTASGACEFDVIALRGMLDTGSSGLRFADIHTL